MEMWRCVFYLAAGTSALIFFSGLVSSDADTPSTETVRRVDWIGVFLVIIGLVLIVFILGQGEIAPQGWKHPVRVILVSYIPFVSSLIDIIALHIIGIIMVVLFVLWKDICNRFEMIHQDRRPYGHLLR